MIKYQFYASFSTSARLQRGRVFYLLFEFVSLWTLVPATSAKWVYRPTRRRPPYQLTGTRGGTGVIVATGAKTTRRDVAITKQDQQWQHFIIYKLLLLCCGIWQIIFYCYSQCRRLVNSGVHYKATAAQLSSSGGSLLILITNTTGTPSTAEAYTRQDNSGACRC